MNKLSDDELLAALGVEREEEKQKTYSAVEERVIAGFEDIVRFFDEHGRVPRHGEQNDIFERLYAVRLDRLCEDAHWREFLLPFDEHHLLDETSCEKTETIKLDDDALLTELGVAAPSEDSIENLRHVRPHTEKTQPEEIASRKPVADFGEFKINLTYDDARALAERALKFKEERGRLPSITAQDPWEKRMAEGVAWLISTRLRKLMLFYPRP